MKKGQIVLSKAGRDCGSYLIVHSVTNDGIYVVDGKERPVEKPKRKNSKHLGTTNHCLSEEAFATNKAARKALREAVKKDENLKGEKKCLKKI